MSESSSQRFFWHESVASLRSQYERFRAIDDNANALACFHRLAQHGFRGLLGMHDFDPSRKSIISAFQAKSGGTYLHNRMLQLGYKEFSWFFMHRLCHSLCYASDDALKLYLSGGCTCHTHARPHPNILAALDRARVEKIWVHLRNPAECAVSAYHHYCGEGHGEGEIGQQRREKALTDSRRLPVHPEIGKSEFVMQTIDWHAEWAAMWLQFAQTRPDLVVFSFYRDLADPHAMLSRVFRELGAELKGNVSAEPIGQDRFRRKESSDWRTDLSPAAQSQVEHRVREIIGHFPAFDSLWS
ncbi:MAG: hypothetical protein WD738_16250 [Pirellulales bacterium]